MQNILKGLSLILFGIAMILTALVAGIARWEFLYLSVELTVVFTFIGLIVSIIGLTFVFRQNDK